MAYAVVDVIVEGALESSETFHDETLLNERLAEIKADAEADGYVTEVYVLYHDHADEIECECAQYVTDGHPTYTYPEATRDPLEQADLDMLETGNAGI